MTVSILCTIVSDFFARLFNSFPSANEVLRGQMKGPLIDGENTPFAMAYDETIFHRLHQIKPKGIARSRNSFPHRQFITFQNQIIVPKDGIQKIIKRNDSEKEATLLLLSI